jgi:hypothetical protein
MTGILLLEKIRERDGYKLQQNHVAEVALERLGDLENYPDENLVPYESLSYSTERPTTSLPAGSSTAKTQEPKR